MHRLRFYFACIAIASGGFSCREETSTAQPLPASLTEDEKILGQTNDNCLSAIDASRFTLTTALEAQSVGIDAYVRQNLPEDAHYRRVMLGPTYVRELVSPLAPSAPLTTDWRVLSQQLDDVRAEPFNTTWVALNESVRSAVVDDWLRLIDHTDDTPSGAAKRALPGIAHRNPGVTREDGTFHVKLDAGAFDGARDALRAVIEPVWSNVSHHLTIDFVSGDPDAFSVVLEEVPGGRSMVQWTDRTVHLYPDVRERSIAHEVGHVLGFGDHYLTVFDPVRCVYTQTADPSDLMADAARGSVTDAEWSALDATY